MTYFKLSLLTPQFDNNSNYFFEDVISEFYSQQDTYKDNKYYDKVNGLQDVVKNILQSSREETASEHDINRDQLSLDPLLLAKDTPGFRDDNIEGYESVTDAFDHSSLTQKPIFCYSYNEKLTLSKNAQKTLTFSMNRMITVENEWKENPFIRNISIGTQLLLIDQYNNEYFFTIKDIKYNIKENNIIYDITCQDSFSYQTIRQNSGYTIDNDPSSTDFIGALTLDEWIDQYIVPDCKIAYQYIPLTHFLYLDTNNQLHTCSYLDFNTGNINNIKRILKYGYNPNIEYEDDAHTIIKNAHDSAFFDAVPFSCSGSNANAALISLGEQMGFHLNTCEHNKYNNNLRTKSYDRYFWLEPEKNMNRLGLTYSPNNSIQFFNFSHKGDSLTTVLNIESNTFDDEVVSLFPTVPAIFYRWFMTPEWRESGYYPGMFSALCRNKIYYNIDIRPDQVNDKYWFFARLDELDIEHNYTLEGFIPGKEYSEQDKPLPIIKSDVKPWFDKEHEKFLYFPIWTTENNNQRTFHIPTLYEKVSFKDWNYTDVSELIFNGTDIVTSRGYKWDLILLNEYSRKDSEDIEHKYYKYYIIREDTDPLPIFSSLENNIYAFIRIYIGNNIDLTNFSVKKELYLNFYRTVTTDEQEFAEIADACPWLENKLIDFSYFYNNKILSKEEYSSLMDIIYNDLRIVNGHLMFFSQSYYRALHNRTKLLADLTNSLDALGASCQADIIDPIKQQGKITSIESFRNAYLTFTAPIVRTIELLNYGDILTDYFNKYFDAQQRFLKNIYNFTSYFNAINSLNQQFLYTYTLEITDPLDAQLMRTKPSDDSSSWNPIFNADKELIGYEAEIQYDYQYKYE